MDVLTFIQQPVERIQTYQALLKVRNCYCFPQCSDCSDLDVTLMLRLLLAGVNQEQSQKWPKLLSVGKVFLHGVLSALEV